MRIYSPELESITTGTPDPTNPILMLDATGNVIRGEAGGGTTINTTDTFLPVRTDATTFGDSYISQPVSGEGGSTLLISVDQPFVSAIRLEATDTFSGIEIVAQGIDSGFGVGGINIESQDGNVNLRAGNAGFGTATNGNVTITAAGATSEIQFFSPDIIAPSTGTTGLAIDSTGKVVTSAGGGTTINPTDNVLPYRTSATTFGDSVITTSFTGTTYTDGIDTTAQASSIPPNGGIPNNFCVLLVDANVFANSTVGQIYTSLGDGAAYGIVALTNTNEVRLANTDGTGFADNAAAGNVAITLTASLAITTNYNISTSGLAANGASIGGNLTLGINSSTATSTGQAIGVNTTGEVVTIDAGGGTNPTSTFLPINVDGVFVDSAVSQPGPGCNGGTDVLDQSQRSSTGSGGYGFYADAGSEIADQTTLSATTFNNIELNAGAENPNNTFPIPQTPSDAPFTDLEIAVLEAAGFVITDVQALASSVSQTRNAPADFDSFTTTWTQAGTTASFLLNVSSVKVVRANGKVYIGGSGAAVSAGPASVAPAVNGIQASDYVTEPSGSYRRSVESNVDPFNLTTRQSGDWNVGCVFGSAVTVTTNLDVAGTSTTTPGGVNTFSMDFGATGLATALQTTVGFRLTGFGTDGSAAGGLAQFLNDNNIQSGDDIFITGTGTGGGTGTFRFLEFPFAPGNLNSVVFDGYAADGLPTEASDTVAGGLNPSVGVTAFQDEISNSTTQTVTYTSAASTTTVGGDLTVASGVFLNNLPTSDPGVTGQVWNNAGVLNISL